MIPKQLLPFLQQAIDSGVELVSYTVANQHHDYLVLLAELRHPALQVVIKLAGPESPLAADFDRTAALHRLVAAHTTIPMPDLLTVDVSYQHWPWRYLIRTQIAGQELATIRPHLRPDELTPIFRQFGNAVAQLHAIPFSSFGKLGSDGTPQTPQPYLPALRQHAAFIIPNPRLLDRFLAILDRDAALFADVHIPTLCHEDLHHHNILFDNQHGQWNLATILDFDKAWAGHLESDLARLDLWAGMTNDAFWQGYTARHAIDPLYPQRRPLYQLLWCLEYAQPTPQHLTATNRLLHQLGLQPIQHFN